MALMPEGTKPREEIIPRFHIAQDGPATREELTYQDEFRIELAELADELNYRVADSREKSLALTHLEEALMWAGKAIFKS